MSIFGFHSKILNKTGRFVRSGLSLAAGVTVAVVVQAVLGSILDNI
jgi:hypothetical protein